jgi:hypothetical protein
MRKFFYMLLVLLVAFGAPLRAQEAPAVKASDLRDAPQRYWAGFFVFTDVLTEAPGERATRVDDGDVFKFTTSEVGDVYAEPAAAATLRGASPGDEFLFFATVKQQKSGLWGRLRGGEFMVIVKEAAIVERDEEVIASLLAGAAAADDTNATARVLFTLNEVSQVAQQELFGFAQSEGLTVEEVLTSPEHQQKVAASIRNALRKYEQQSRSSSQELFVGVIRSLLASTSGAGATREPAPEYAPEDIELYESMDTAAAIDASLTGALTESQAALEREMAARTTAEARVMELQGRVDQLTTQMKALMEEQPEDGSPQPGLAVALELANVELEQETAARAAAEARVADLQAQVDNLAARVDALNAEALAANQDVETRIADAWASARADLEREATARAKAEARVNELLAQLDEIGTGAPGVLTSEINEELEATRAGLAAEIENSRAAEERIAELTSEIEQLKRQDLAVNELAVALDDARKRLAMQAEARSEMEARVTELERALLEASRPAVPGLRMEAPRSIKRVVPGEASRTPNPRAPIPMSR